MVTIIAHRGARSIAPENTISAAKQAFKTGADLWETDITVTRDEQLILLHDNSFERTTNIASVFPERQHRMAVEFNLSEVRRLDLGAHFIENDPFGEIEKGAISREILASFKKEKVPTLKEALIFTKEKHWKVNLELKTLSGKFKKFPLTQRVIELIRTLSIDPDHLILSSFNHSWLRQVQAMEPAIEIQALIGCFKLKPLDWGDFSFPVYNARSTLIDEDQVARIKTGGKKINLFTVNEKDEMIRFINMGVNGLITDYPQRLASIIKEQ